MNEHSANKKKIILIRLDKIGDLICTLPVDQALPSQDEVLWVVQKGLGAVVELGAQPRNFIELDKAQAKESAKKLAQVLKQFKPDVAISFQSPWWVNFEIFKAGIATRAGVMSQWHSFLFLNKGLRQKRSRSEKHEFDYNLELVEKTLNLKSTRRFYKFDLKPQTDLALLQTFNLEAKKYIVVHPGMMGSALNIKQSQYIHWLHQKIAQQQTIVITGTDADQPYLNEIKLVFAEHPQVRWLCSKLNLKQLTLILSQAQVVVAPSTGVAHLAASADVKTIGIYSPIRVHHPRRWAPRGAYVEVLLPKVNCPADHYCLKEKCPAYNCMDQISEQLKNHPLPD